MKSWSLLPQIQMCGVACGLVAVIATGAAGAAEPLRDRLAAVEVIRLSPGANTVPGFAPDGRTALITLGWRDNGNAHGFDVYMVMLPTRVGETDWNVVGLDAGTGVEPIITDSPHTGDDVVRSVRFAHGLLDGRRATLLFIATRGLDPDQGIPGPSRTEIAAYALRANTDGVGLTRDYFAPVARYTTTMTYCNAEVALNQEIGLPLTRSYVGPKTRSGC